MRGAKKHKLDGLAFLGARLKELRVSAGISQMKLAELLGLNPTHGYKYILRLEKGLIPNPTMRTITGYLTACKASWKDLAEVLPSLKLKPSSEEKPASPESISIPPQPSPIPTFFQAGAPSAETSTGTPFSEDYWCRVKDAQDQLWDLLRLSHPTGVQRRAYFVFVRSVCMTIFQFRTDPKSLNTALERLLAQASKQGLNPPILTQAIKICRKALGLDNSS